MTNKLKILGFCLVATLMVFSSSCKSKNPVVKADDYDFDNVLDLVSLINKDNQGVDYKSKLGDKGSNKAKVSIPFDGRWTIIEAGGKKISQDEDMPYLIFSDEENRFYASNGCNVINGDFTYTPDESTVEFNNVLTTMAECPDIKYQQDINVVLNNGVSVKTVIEHKGIESYLYIKSRSNDLLLTLRRNNMDILSGQWLVKKIENEDIDNEGMNVFIDIPLLSIHGNTGCNYFNGKIEVDPFSPVSLSFTQMGVTMRLCENEDLERKMLVALEQVTSYKLKSQDSLELMGDDNKILMELTRDTDLK